MTTTKKSVIIAGGGIGGLVTALKLYRGGASVRVFESVQEIRELGVGINLLPHAVRVLTELGLADELEKAGVKTAELRYFSKYGQEIWQEPRGLASGYKWPQYSIHRGRLQMILYNAVKRELGEEAVITGHHLSSFERYDDRVEVQFEDRKTGQKLGTYQADMLIAADGIHSVVRKAFYPNEGDPIFSGRILWRGLTESSQFLTGKTMIMSGYQDQKFVAYPICPDALAEGKSLVNWIAELTINDEAPPRTDWNKKIDKQKFAPDFANWEFDFLDIPKLIEETEDVYEFPMVDRDPLPQWSFGRVTLLGDAAHPMYPIGSNGASQAILDADALGIALAEEDDVASALRAYEQARLEPTASIVRSNRQNGPEVVMQIVEERAPNGFEHLHDVISQEELESISNKYKKIAGFDKERLNKMTV
ncbi:2-polyprenyl-6-methoxyphenol hydroxylase and related FAD-dependent oxidoreductases [Halalkalibacter wakoensis JCM 9140]|uniref:2-polyprenyl-6-methoxyphenol hydroxylase and related FAD-dependent oxidoreductases n=1 Tax=Halalkalibacter wakoensis JCM 9140 TaxID=1236970 RepID=W4Q8R8_9BACI|nr:flavin-dependent oxidoreductase [Halalkalibacter wakoensis]GAE28372.1 2-polyprenyl-6-methoxyphenol hydroxylase and related FAD-dependent oxidoreductases [Halalkalibacter wakoensis JCM 9140]